MEEIASTSNMSLWPSLKKKLGDAKKKTTRKKQKKSNPFASQGLEKFALLMAELQAKKTSLVDKTGNSVSAVRYLSRSAQEWTASTIARTASRRREKDTSPKASEILLLQQSPLLPDSHSKETAEVEIVDFSRSFSFPDPGHSHDYGFDSEVLVVGDLQRETKAVSETAEETREPCEEEFQEREEVGCSGKTEKSGLPAKSARLIRTGRLFLLEKGWARSPNSAVALLVALSACVVARVTKIGNSFFELLTVDLVFRWQKGKLYADFLQSLVTRHIVPHLSIRVPRGLALLPLVRRKRSPELDHEIPQTSLTSTQEQSEIECEHKPNPGFSFPVVPESSSRDCPNLAEPQLRIDALESDPPALSKIKTSSSTRGLVRKLSSKLKAKISKSPTSGSPNSPDSSHSHSSGTSSPRKGSIFSFSRRDKEKETSSDDGWPDDEVFADSASSSKKRCILGKKCSLRKEKTAESSIRRSPLGRTEIISSTEITSSLHDARNPPSVWDTGRMNFDLWLVMGLSVALLFLLVSRFSAIVATSLLFLLLSHTHKQSSKYRMPRRETPRMSLRSARFDSPSREETSSNEFYRRGEN